MSGAPRVAVIGAGIAGASCARILADAGLSVQVFDKSRGVGGRMTTRRVDWTDASGVTHTASFDHGTSCFSEHAPDFSDFVAEAQRAGLVAPWTPAIAAGSHVTPDLTELWVATPDMPALCRHLLQDVPLQTLCAIDAFSRSADGWHLHSEGTTIAAGFDAVVVAIPPLQAAALLQAHQPDWAQQATARTMLPGWTLMGITADRGTRIDWDLACPPAGPLAKIVRNDSKPGRSSLPGHTHWVLHASAAWSADHLELSAAEVQPLLQQAMADWLGQPLSWTYSTVHRWRYATVPAGSASVDRHWWDADAGIGVCGDAWGGAGVEGAWLSAQALASAILISAA
ncbi:MAG: NAD(P)/FAD-dependent oxidoreductase [Sphingomonadaceae bacterium]